MPAQYEAIRDSYVKAGKPLATAKRLAAMTFNAHRPSGVAPVGPHSDKPRRKLKFPSPEKHQMTKPTHKAVRNKTTPDEIENGASKPSATVTDAKQIPKLDPDAHAEHRMARHVERSGHVIAQVEVPAHTAEISLGHSAVEGAALAAAEAWDSIEKAKDDADFAHSTKLHRQDLINHAEEVFTSGIAMGGDTTIAKFERAVLKIKARLDKDKAAKAA